MGKKIGVLCIVGVCFGGVALVSSLLSGKWDWAVVNGGFLFLDAALGYFNFKGVFHKQRANPQKEYNKAVEAFNESAKELSHKVIDVSIDTLAQRSIPASQQDIGRFMKHGKQLPYYRKSVKAKVQPEEDEQ